MGEFLPPRVISLAKENPPFPHPTRSSIVRIGYATVDNGNG